MANYQDIQQVCLNGHQITSTYNRSPEDRKKHCSVCGAETIHQCPNCGHPIPGYKFITGVIYPGSSYPPSFCKECGKPYPWTEKRPPTLGTPSRDPVGTVIKILERFHGASSKLKTRREKRDPVLMNDEYDVQYLLHSFLALHFEDIRPEEWSPSYAGRSSRMDFLLKSEQIVVEVKMTRDKLKDKEVGDELTIDIHHYQSHQDCKTLICFVYDPGDQIRNPKALENDLSKKYDDVTVIVKILPKK